MEKVVLDRPEGSWRLRCSAWAPSRHELYEFKDLAGVLRWVEKVRAWAESGRAVYKSTDHRVYTLWELENGEEKTYPENHELVLKLTS